MREFHFILREVLERDVIVVAASAAEARKMVFDSGDGPVNEEPEGVMLGDLKSMSITLRSVRADYLVEKLVDQPEDLSYPSRNSNESGDRP